VLDLLEGNILHKLSFFVSSNLRHRAEGRAATKESDNWSGVRGDLGKGSGTRNKSPINCGFTMVQIGLKG